MVKQASCLSVQARCLHYPIHKRYFSNSQVPKAAEDAIQGEGGLAVSSISVWEVMLLVQKKRLRLAIDVQEWIKKNEQMPFLRFLPLTNSIAVQSVLLPPPLHGDPADRIIAATACIHNMALITKDSRLQTCPEVRTIW